MKKELLVAVQVETNRAHGRSMLEGIADYALAHTDATHADSQLAYSLRQD